HDDASAHTLYLFFTAAASSCSLCFSFTATAPTEIYTLSLHDALPISAVTKLDSVISVGDKMRETPKMIKIYHTTANTTEKTSNCPIRFRGKLISSEA